MKTVKLKFKFGYDSATALVMYLEDILETPPIDDYEMLLLAVLAEILEYLKPKMVFHEKEYSIKLTAAQAVALRMIYLQTRINGEHFNNEMLMLSNTIHQQYYI